MKRWNIGKFLEQDPPNFYQADFTKIFKFVSRKTGEDMKGRRQPDTNPVMRRKNAKLLTDNRNKRKLK